MSGIKEVKPSRFKKWHEKNREALNAKRRERNRNDPAYRAKNLANVHRWRARQPSTEPNADGTYSLYAAAHVLGRSVPTLRVWEKKGYLPFKPHVARVYTRANLQLMRKLADFMDIKPRLLRGYQERLQVVVREVHEKWVFHGDNV